MTPIGYSIYIYICLNTRLKADKLGTNNKGTIKTKLKYVDIIILQQTEH